MPNNKIAKIIPQVEVNILNSKLVKLNTRDTSIFVGENIEISAKINEGLLPKTLNSDCKVNILYSCNGISVEHRFEEGGIEIDLINSIITVNPKKNAIKVGSNTIDLSIIDTDEIIKVPSLVLSAIDTIESEKIEDATDDIKTLNELKDRINETIANLVIINTGIDELNKKLIDGNIKIDNTFVEINDKIEVNVSSIEDKLQTLEDKINNKTNEIDTMFLKSVMLEPYINGNFVSFRSPIINKEAYNLVKYSFMVHINGSPYVDSVQTAAIGIVNFTNEFDATLTTYTALVDKSVQGNNISPVATFNGSTTQVYKNNYGYRLVINTKINKLYFNEAHCKLTPISGGLL